MMDENIGQEKKEPESVRRERQQREIERNRRRVTLFKRADHCFERAFSMIESNTSSSPQHMPAVTGYALVGLLSLALLHERDLREDGY